MLDLGRLCGDAFILTPRAIGPTLFDTVVAACRAAGFEPVPGQAAPQIAAVVNLAAAGMGVSLVPACMQALQVSGVVYRAIAGTALVARLTLAFRRAETSRVVLNFIAHTGV